MANNPLINGSFTKTSFYTGPQTGVDRNINRDFTGSYDGEDKLVEISLQVEQVKEIIHKNIDAVISRGEDLDSLQGKTEDLAQNARIFNSKTKDMNRALCLKKAKITALFVISILIVIGVLAEIIYWMSK